MRALPWSAVILCLLGAKPYVVGGTDDPNAGGKAAPPVVEHARIAPLRTIRYAERFALDDVALSADGMLVAAVGKTSRQGIKAWEVGSGKGVDLPELPTAATALAWDGGAQRLALGLAADVMSEAGSGLQAFDLGHGARGPLVADADGAITLAWDPGSSRVAVGLSLGLGLWDVDTGQGGVVLREGRVEAMVWSAPDEVYVAAQGGAALLRVRLPSAEIAERWEGQKAEGPLCFSPTGRIVVEGGEEGLTLYDLWEGGAPQRVATGVRVTALAWSADGKVLAAGTTEGEILLYAVDGVSGRKAAELSSPKKAESTRSVGVESRDRRGDPGPVQALPSNRRREDRGTGGLGSRDEGTGAALDLDRGRGDPGGKGGVEKIEEPTVVVVPSFEIVIVEQLGGDPRTNKSLTGALVKNQKSLEGCWKKAANRGEPVSGEIVLDLGVSPDGEGVSIEDPASDTVGNEKLLTCVREKLRHSMFGPGLGSMDVRLRIELTVTTSAP